MYFYLTIHLCVLLSIFFELGNQNVKKYVLWFWVLFFTCIGGFRWNVGDDWDQYYYYFENCSLFHIFDTIRYGEDFLEPGFVFLQAISKLILKKYYIYNILLTFFYQFTIVRISKRYSPKYPILMYAFIMTVTGTASYGAVRAGLAAAIMYWAYPYIEKRDLKKFLLVVFIGASIHVLSIVMLPFYWIGKFKFNYLTATILYFVVAFGSVYFRNYLLQVPMFLGGNIAYKAELYANGQTVGFTGSTSYGWFLYYFLFMLFIYMRQYSKNEYFYNTLLMLFFVLRAIMMTFSEGMGDLTRLSAGLGPVFPVLMLFSFTKLMESKKGFLVISAIALYVAVNVYHFGKIGAGYYFENSYVPYKTIFDYNSLGKPMWY